MVRSNFSLQKLFLWLSILVLTGCGGDGAANGNSQFANSPTSNSLLISSSSLSSVSNSELSSQVSLPSSSSQMSSIVDAPSSTSSFSSAISSSSQSSTLIISSSSDSSSSMPSRSSSAVSSSSSSSSSYGGRDLANTMEGEHNERNSGIWYEINNDDASGQHVAGVDAGDYIEWIIYVPTGGNFKLTSRSASVLPSGQQIQLDGVEVAEIGLTTTGSFSTWQSFDSSSFRMSAGMHVLRIQFTTSYQILNWVKISSSQANSAEGFETGLWRVVDRENRLTLTRNAFSANLIESEYSGNIKQQWRLKKITEDRYEFKLESSGECLIPSVNGAGLGACGNVSAYWAIDMLRLRSEDRPAIYRLRSPFDTCLIAHVVTGVSVGSCDNHARWYIEAVGYDERSKPAEYEVRSLLLIKEFTNAHGIIPASIDPNIMAAARTSYESDVAIWFKRMTDGRVVWKAETVISPNPLTSFTEGGGNYLPAAVNVPDDVQQFVPRGKYDTVTVFFTASNVSGGWGWGPGSSKESNYTLWATVNGGTVPAAQWISGENEPTEVFIHEPMHGFDAHFDRFGLPLPEGYLHGAETNKYTHETDGWMPWYRDYWLGTVIASDDTYRGYGPRMFRRETVRSFAAAKESVAPGKIIHLTSGMCLSTKNGVIDPSAGAEVVFSFACNTGASSFQLRENGMLEFMGSSGSGTGYCVHPAGGTANVGAPLVLWPACIDPGLPVQITNQGSIQNIKSGLCVHPLGGSSMPAEGTSSVYWSGCEADHLKFKLTH